MIQNTDKKLHLGCGFKHLDGYINIDMIKNSKADEILDLEREGLKKYKDGSVSHILAEHFFEHLANFEFVLKECHRVLKVGGTMRIVVPYATSLAGDYEYHKIRPRYDVYKDFEERKDTMNDNTLPKFRFKRYLRFSWYLYPLNLFNISKKLIYVYEQTGLRYLFPAMLVELDMVKV